MVVIPAKLFEMEEVEKLLSREGRCAIKDNGITMENLLRFSDNDVKDLFTNFMDRFHVRQFCSAHTTSSTTVAKPQGCDNTSINDPMEFLDSDQDMNLSVCSTESSNSDLALGLTSADKSHVPKCSFSVDELMTKKGQRKAPSGAQRYFASLIRDAAYAANIWKAAPPLSSISTTRRNLFFETVFEVAPQLRVKEREVWQRLGAILQNRRKYLKDKASGLRFSTKKSTPVSDSLQLAMGSHVYLLDKEGREAGQGIVINTSGHDQMFLEIAVKSVSTLLHSDDELELPEPVTIHGCKYISLSPELIKCIIKWKKDRLSTKKPTSRVIHGQKSTSDAAPSIDRMSSKKPEQDHLDVGQSTEHVKLKDIKDRVSSKKPDQGAGQSTVKSKDRVLSKKLDQTVGHSTLKTKDRVSSKKPDQSTGQSTVKLSRERVSTSTLVPSSVKETEKHELQDATKCTSTSSKSVKFKSFVLMEWSNRKLYWGILQTVDFTNDTLVRNAVKCCGKVQDSSAKEIVAVSRNVKLCATDIEINPNMSFCVLNIPAENDLLALVDDGTELTIAVKNEPELVNILQEHLDAYE